MHRSLVYISRIGGGTRPERISCAIEGEGSRNGSNRDNAGVVSRNPSFEQNATRETLYDFYPLSPSFPPPLHADWEREF